MRRAVPVLTSSFFLLLTACPATPPAADAGVPMLHVDLRGAMQGTSGGFIDVDGDGLLDKVVGAPRAQFQGQLGALLVYRGAADGFEARLSQVLAGQDGLGTTFLPLGDVDGDGRADFAAGAPFGGSDDCGLCGSVTVYRGGTGGQVWATLSSGVPAGRLGMSLVAGDFDQDGALDVAAGSPFDSPTADLFQAGSVTVFFGPHFSRQVKVDATAQVKGLGWGLAAGDADGDSKVDLIVGASGKVLVFSGNPGFTPVASAPDATISSTFTGFGQVLAAPGDVDGDGVGDLLISAAKVAVGGQRDTGVVFVVKGGPGPRTINLGATPAPAELISQLAGPGLVGRFGSAVAGVGDIDADGRADFVVGAPMADGQANDLRGKAFFFKGKDLSPTTTLADSVGFEGDGRNQAFGTSFATTPSGALMVGAPRADDTAGRVTVVDLATGKAVPGGASGGVGGGQHCHDEHC